MPRTTAAPGTWRTRCPRTPPCIGPGTRRTAGPGGSSAPPAGNRPRLSETRSAKAATAYKFRVLLLSHDRQPGHAVGVQDPFDLQTLPREDRVQFVAERPVPAAHPHRDVERIAQPGWVVLRPHRREGQLGRRAFGE